MHDASASPPYSLGALVNTTDWALNGGGTTVPSSAVGMNLFRGASKRRGFKVLMNGKTLKYDATTNAIRLNAGVEMILEVVSDVTVFNNGEDSTRRRFALRNIASNQFVAWNNSNYTLSSFVANSPNLAFRFILFDGGASFRMFNDKFSSHPHYGLTFTAPGTTSTTDYSMYPYVQTWLAYAAASDLVVPVYWADTILPTSCSFDDLSSVPSSAINYVNPVSHFRLPYPCRPIISFSTALTNSFDLAGMLYGTGTNIVSASIQQSTRQSHKVFNGSTGTLEDCWQPGGNGIGFDHWVQIQLPVPIKLHSYIIDLGGGTVASRSPSSWEVYGIVQGGSTPVLLHSGSRPAFIGFDQTGGVWHFVVNNNILYNRFRFVIKGFNQSQTLVSVPELRFFGSQV
jgi:hypothetical protein